MPLHPRFRTVRFGAGGAHGNREARNMTDGRWSRGATLAATVAIGLTLAGCGGGASSPAQNAAARPAGATAVRDSTATTAVAASGGSGGGSLCTLIRTYHQRVADLAAQGLGDPGRLRQLMVDVVSALDQAVGIAPADVRADLTLIRDATKQYDAVLAKAGYDVTKLSRGADNPLLHDDVQAASERQGAYAHDACGVQN
jgi:hypothetical protein